MSDTTSTEDRSTDLVEDRPADDPSSEVVPTADPGASESTTHQEPAGDAHDSGDGADVADADDDAADVVGAAEGAVAEGAVAEGGAAEGGAAEGGNGEGGNGEGGNGEAVAAGTPERPTKGSRVRQLEREGEVAADFLETLLDIADLDGDLEVDVDGDRAAVSIVDSDEGRVPRRLVGPDGKVLEALQELTRLAVQVETGERSRLMLDIAGHRAERRAALVELARGAIEEVKASGEKRSLDPMSAFERKVVHDEVAAAGLESESEGMDPRRHVVILPA
jgi:spoIIIJ-associated protein